MATNTQKPSLVELTKNLPGAAAKTAQSRIKNLGKSIVKAPKNLAMKGVMVAHNAISEELPEVGAALGFVAGIGAEIHARASGKKLKGQRGSSGGIGGTNGTVGSTAGNNMGGSPEIIAILNSIDSGIKIISREALGIHAELRTLSSITAKVWDVSKKSLLATRQGNLQQLELERENRFKLQEDEDKPKGVVGMAMGAGKYLNDDEAAEGIKGAAGNAVKAAVEAVVGEKAVEFGFKKIGNWFKSVKSSKLANKINAKIKDNLDDIEKFNKEIDRLTNEETDMVEGFKKGGKYHGMPIQKFQAKLDEIKKGRNWAWEHQDTLKNANEELIRKSPKGFSLGKDGLLEKSAMAEDTGSLADGLATKTASKFSKILGRLNIAGKILGVAGIFSDTLKAGYDAKKEGDSKLLSIAKIFSTAAEDVTEFGVALETGAWIPLLADSIAKAVAPEWYKQNVQPIKDASEAQAGETLRRIVDEDPADHTSQIDDLVRKFVPTYKQKKPVTDLTGGSTTPTITPQPSPNTMNTVAIHQGSQQISKAQDAASFGNISSSRPPALPTSIVSAPTTNISNNTSINNSSSREDRPLYKYFAQ